jgi:hypothetical protein
MIGQLAKSGRRLALVALEHAPILLRVLELADEEDVVLAALGSAPRGTGPPSTARASAPATPR